MTLIISAGNSEQFVQVSDRRLTRNGVLQDDESNKAIVLNCANARLALGFTGLAKAGDFETREWLLSTISECGPPDFTAQAVLERVREKATQVFQNLPVLKNLPKINKRLSIMFSGYLYHHNPPLGGVAILTNFQHIDSDKNSIEAWDHFKCFYREKPRPNDVLLHAIGTIPPIDPQDISRLEDLLKSGRAAEAIIGKLINIFNKLSDSPSSQGLIGKQLTSIILPIERNISAESAYHSKIVKYDTYMPDQIYIEKHRHLTISDVSLEQVFEERKAPISGPKLKPNQPCWCSSGIKYKYCHGKISKNKICLQIIAEPKKE
jgi:hypothetical protein